MVVGLWTTTRHQNNQVHWKMFLGELSAFFPLSNRSGCSLLHHNSGYCLLHHNSKCTLSVLLFIFILPVCHFFLKTKSTLTVCTLNVPFCSYTLKQLFSIAWNESRLGSTCFLCKCFPVFYSAQKQDFAHVFQ